MKNTVKRLFSCLSILLVFLLSTMGIEAKTLNTIPIKNIIKQKKSAEINTNNFMLYSGTNTGKINNDKLADHYSHYSHSSHVSHQSHYSSRY